MTKLNKNQLLETIRDTIYEVLEEEIDRKIKEAKVAKTRRLNESKAKRVRARKELKALQEKKEKLKKMYAELNKKEKALKNSK